MTLIGNDRHRKFRSLNLSSASSTKKDLEKLLQFLEQDMHKKGDENLSLLKTFKDKLINNCDAPLLRHSKHISCVSNSVGVTQITENPSFGDFEGVPDIKVCYFSTSNH